MHPKTCQKRFQNRSWNRDPWPPHPGTAQGRLLMLKGVLGVPRSAPIFDQKPKKTISRGMWQIMFFSAPCSIMKKHRINGPKSPRGARSDQFLMILEMLWETFLDVFWSFLQNQSNRVFCREYNVKIVFCYDQGRSKSNKIPAKNVHIFMTL